MKYLFFLFLMVSSLLHGVEKQTLYVCAYYLDDDQNLKHWINYHRKVGAKHFSVYHDEISQSTQDILDPFIRRGIIEENYEIMCPGILIFFFTLDVDTTTKIKKITILKNPNVTTQILWSVIH